MITSKNFFGCFFCIFMMPFWIDSSCFMLSGYFGVCVECVVLFDLLVNCGISSNLIASLDKREFRNLVRYTESIPSKGWNKTGFPVVEKFEIILPRNAKIIFA